MLSTSTLFDTWKNRSYEALLQASEKSVMYCIRFTGFRQISVVFEQLSACTYILRRQLHVKNQFKCCLRQVSSVCSVC